MSSCSWLATFAAMYTTTRAEHLGCAMLIKRSLVRSDIDTFCGEEMFDVASGKQS